MTELILEINSIMMYNKYIINKGYHYVDFKCSAK